MNDLKRRIAADLLEIQAVFLRPDQPFTWVSGIRSPIYTDNRLTLSEPGVRMRIEEGLSAMIRDRYAACEAVMGTATAGIAHAAIVAHLLELPMGYVRSGSKDHGRQNQIEGRLHPGQKVVLIEDLISTGGSVLAAAETLRGAGAEVLGVLAIFNYGMRKAVEGFARAGLELHTLTDLDVLVDIAVDRGDIRPEDRPRLLAFRDNPQDEGWMSAQALRTPQEKGGRAIG